ncbi:polysaccharide biosynthesis C-terminal domain-containing protein [Methanolobus sp. WCC4]|uniref:oligosaccharide flippase family protein n=1 Tax=Methanolobus sp. WCC4 TaxID=3125784 RepID=UPI0030FC89A2
MSSLKSIHSNIMSIGQVQRQSLISFVTQLAFTFLGFLSTMYFAHKVGSSVLGAYFLFTAYYGISSMLSDGGLGSAAIKRISEGEEQDSYFSAFFTLRLILLIAVIILLLSVKEYFVDLNSEGIFVWLILALLLSIFHGSVHHGIAGSGKMGLFATGTFVNNVSRIVFQVVAVYIGFRTAGMVAGFVGGMLVSLIMEFHFLDLKLTSFNLTHIKSLLSFSFWLVLISSSHMVFAYADTITIGYFLNNSDVGVYRVIFQFVTIATLSTAALRSTLWPKVSRWGKTRKYKSIEESLSRSISYSLLFAIPIFVGGALLGDKLLYYFYGAEFVHGYTTLFILLCMQIISIFQILFTAYLSALDCQKKSFQVTAIAALLNIIVNVILIPTMGINGAAIATLAAMALNALLAYSELSNKISITFEYDSILHMILSSLAMGLILWTYRLFLPLSNLWFVIILVLFGGLIYSIFMLKVDKKIYEEFNSIMQKIGTI